MFDTALRLDAPGPRGVPVVTDDETFHRPGEVFHLASPTSS